MVRRKGATPAWGGRSSRHLVVFCVLFAGLFGISLVASVWAAPGQAPDRATVPTRTKTYTPGPTAVPTEAVQASMTPLPTFTRTPTLAVPTPTGTEPTPQPPSSTPSVTPITATPTGTPLIPTVTGTPLTATATGTPLVATATLTPTRSPSYTPAAPSVTPTGPTAYPDPLMGTVTPVVRTRTVTPMSARTGGPTAPPSATLTGAERVAAAYPAPGGAQALQSGLASTPQRSGTIQAKSVAGAAPPMASPEASRGSSDRRQRTLIARLFPIETGSPTYNPSRAGDEEGADDGPNGWLVAGAALFGVGLAGAGAYWFRQGRAT